MKWFANRFIGMLIRPREEWRRVEADDRVSHTIAYALLQVLLTSCVVFLLTAFRRGGLSGLGTIMQNWLNVVALYIFSDMQIEGRFPLVEEAVAITMTAVALVADWLFDALIVNLFAPAFGAKRNYHSALKLVSFSLTPFFFVGFLSIVPVLRILLVPLAVYFFVLLWKGLPVLMSHPQAKRWRYFLFSVFVVTFVYLSNMVVGPVFILGQLLFI